MIMENFLKSCPDSPNVFENALIYTPYPWSPGPRHNQINSKNKCDNILKTNYEFELKSIWEAGTFCSGAPLDGPDFGFFVKVKSLHKYFCTTVLISRPLNWRCYILY